MKFQGLVSRLGRTYEVIPCTQKTVIDSTLPSLTSASLIVTSVLANFICDAGVLNPDRLLDAANSVISKHISLLHRFSQTSPSTRIVVVPPLSRSNPDWFNPYLPCLLTFLISEIIKTGNAQIRYLSPFVAPANFFLSDGVHLNQDAGYHFIKFIIDGVDQVFPEVSPPSLQSTSMAPPPITSLQPSSTHPGASSQYTYSQAAAPFPSGPPSFSTSTAPTSTNFAVEFGRISSAITSLTGITSSMRTEATTRREQDNLIFARLKEDRDFEFNKNREDRFTVSGLITPNPPVDPRERKAFFIQRLQDLVDEACADVIPRPQVVDVYVNMRPGQTSPFLEGRMDSVSSSSAFRVAASQMSRDESPNFKDLFIANAVTLSTRVRIEILRAISKKLQSDDTDSFVQGFSSRPLLHYHLCEGSFARIDGVNRTYTFVEAVAKFGSLVSQADLFKAYRRARPAFIGCMEQYFVILKETGPEQTPQTGPNAAPLGAPFSYSDRRGGRGGRRPARRGRGVTSFNRRGPAHRSPLVRGSSTLRSPSFSRKRHLEVAASTGVDSGTPSKKAPLTEPSPSDDVMHTDPPVTDPQ